MKEGCLERKEREIKIFEFEHKLGRTSSIYRKRLLERSSRYRGGIKN